MQVYLILWHPEKNVRRLRVRVNMSSARRSGCVVDDGEAGGNGGGGANIRVAPESGGSSGGGGRPSVSGVLVDAESATGTGTERTGRTAMATTTGIESSGVVGDASLGAIAGAGNGSGTRTTRLTFAGQSIASPDGCTATTTAPCTDILL